jgi:hypothetical protein
MSSELRSQARYDAPGVRVEVLGLERWTLKMLQDSIAHYVPGQTLHDAACMATLRYKLHFADASVMNFLGYGRTGVNDFLSIRLVEPKSPAVKWRTVSNDEFKSMLPDYAKLLLPVTDTSGGIWTVRLVSAARFRDSASIANIPANARPELRGDASNILTFLAEHNTDADRRRAMRVLDSNAVYSNRIAAAFILSNFPDHDETWYSLVSALRDPHESVRGAALAALDRMPRRTVNWKPASNDLRILVGGTNIGAMESVMNLLMTTNADPTLAATLLRGNDRWLMRLLSAEAPMASRATRSFLVAMNGGVDLGTSPAAWKAWIARL